MFSVVSDTYLGLIVQTEDIEKWPQYDARRVPQYSKIMKNVLCTGIRYVLAVVQSRFSEWEGPSRIFLRLLYILIAIAITYSYSYCYYIFLGYVQIFYYYL